VKSSKILNSLYIEPGGIRILNMKKVGFVQAGFFIVGNLSFTTTEKLVC